MKKIIIFPILFVILNCAKKSEKQVQPENLKFYLEKVVVINLSESCVTYFKLVIENQSNKSIILSDNSLLELTKGKTSLHKSSFYLENKLDSSTIPLGIDNFYYQKILPNSKKYYFLGGNNLYKSFTIGDSALFKKYLVNSIIRYNGRSLKINNLKKSPYVGKSMFDDFVLNKSDYKAFVDSISIEIPKELTVVYLNRMPILRDDWNKL